MKISDIILIADPDVLAIPVYENQENLIDVSETQDILYGPSPEIENNIDYTKMRLSVYEKLKEAEKYLPQKMKFCLYEAYRSIQLQTFLFNERKEKIILLYPHYTSTEIFHETIKMVSPVINLDGTKNIPPHATGAAIDVYLVDEKGNAVEMGIHPKDWLNDVDGKYSLSHSSLISKEASYHRQIMAEALTAVGFINYPTEYWHWSYGDRYWAYRLKKSCAIYGLI